MNCIELTWIVTAGNPIPQSVDTSASYLVAIFINTVTSAQVALYFAVTPIRHTHWNGATLDLISPTFLVLQLTWCQRVFFSENQKKNCYNVTAWAKFVRDAWVRANAKEIAIYQDRLQKFLVKITPNLICTCHYKARWMQQNRIKFSYFDQDTWLNP